MEIILKQETALPLDGLPVGVFFIIDDTNMSDTEKNQVFKLTKVFLNEQNLSNVNNNLGFIKKGAKTLGSVFTRDRQSAQKIGFEWQDIFSLFLHRGEKICQRPLWPQNILCDVTSAVIYHEEREKNCRPMLLQ